MAALSGRAAELNHRNLQTKARNDFMNSDIRTKEFTFQNTFIQTVLNPFWGLIIGRAKKEDQTLLIWSSEER